MQDYYLKTNNEQELWDCLVALDLAFWSNEFSKFYPKDINLDIIGTIHKPTGNMIINIDGFSMPETQELPGYHANIRGSLTEEQQAQLPLIAAPATPHRVWA
jgi:hypothetical protein